MKLLYVTLAVILAAVVCLCLALALRRLIVHMVNQRVAAWQNDLIEKHCEEVEHMYKKMRGWRHDYKHHIQTMKVHLAMGQYEALDEYLSELDVDLTSVDTVVKTGNVRVDAVLNSKLSVAKSRDIRVNAKAIVPKELPFPEVDLCVIIGNLLDNAIEACGQEPNPDERFIRVYIDIIKKQLYIYVANSMTNNIKKRGISYLSTKGSGHGFGLMRVDQVVARHGGYLNRQHEEGVFATEIMLGLIDR